MIALRGVGKHYGGVAVVHPTDLDVAAGTTTALVGPSGAGKSTLLGIVNGLVTPDTGTAAVAGVAVTPATVLGLRRDRLGYVNQGGGLFPHLSAGENVLLLARHLGWDAPRRARRLAELCAVVGLPDDVMARWPDELSGGQRQRIALMRALLNDPPVLLLDEPLGSLDPVTRNDLQQELRAICRRMQKTVLVVTHDLAEAAYLGDVVALMQAGRVVQRGPVQELLDAPAEPFVARFLSAQRGLDLRRVVDRS